MLLNSLVRYQGYSLIALIAANNMEVVAEHTQSKTSSRSRCAFCTYLSGLGSRKTLLVSSNVRDNFEICK